MSHIPSGLRNRPRSASKVDWLVSARGNSKLSADAFSPATCRPSSQNRGRDKPVKSYFKVANDLENPPKVSGEPDSEKVFSPLVLRFASRAGQPRRRLDEEPFKLLDAPRLQDDFNTNVLDWSRRGIVAVGLGSYVFSYNLATSVADKITSMDEGSTVTCVNWDRGSDLLALSSLSGLVEVFDAFAEKPVRKMQMQTDKIGAVSLLGQLLLTGSRDGSLLLHDLRSPGAPLSFPGHKEGICGLSWSPDGEHFASGDNNNELLVFSPRLQAPIMRKTHEGPVRAIAWSERCANLLATGAGNADHYIRLWNLAEKKLVGFKDTGSQVCNIAFSRKADEVISTHGSPNNEICLWKVKGLQKLATLSGHRSRVLYLAMDPQGDNIVTGAGGEDETLRFWNLGYGPEALAAKKALPELDDCIKM